MSIPKNHYFNPTPEVASRPHTVRLRTGNLDLQLQADRGVFGARRIDLGTLVLLKEAPAPPERGEILDLGAGYGPIAIVLAKASPRARVWAIDINERAVELTRANAILTGTPNITALTPLEVPDDLRCHLLQPSRPHRQGTSSTAAGRMVGPAGTRRARASGGAAQPRLGVIGWVADGDRAQRGAHQVQEGVQGHHRHGTGGLARPSGPPPSHPAPPPPAHLGPRLVRIYRCRQPSLLTAGARSSRPRGRSR